MTLTDEVLINTILHEFHYIVLSVHLSEVRTLDIVQTFSWWPNWRKDVAEYFHICDRCQKSNRATGNKFSIMIQIQEPKFPWAIFHMDWVIALPPGGDRSCNACLVLVDSDRDSKFTSALWTNIHNFFGTKFSISTAYNPHTVGLAERMIQTLEDMIRRFCAYGLQFKDFYGFTHDWCILITSFRLEFKTSIHSSTAKAPEMLKKCCNPRLPYETLKNYLVDVHPKSSSFEIIPEKSIHHAKRCIQDSFKYAKEIWDKMYKPLYFEVGDLVLV
ncbi:hypothetical protein O181_067566 [Austropuccinia psidii MF-1]|uniref:Integrase catalytic domain-containing protein n=1 Tax=Austropuccinia psidii MF-1 TaxID=1389203 RepID=A0A9Q3ET61_9BASI|nr:hypothetical protein [Austropuccinia psidii MF-1]